MHHDALAEARFDAHREVVPGQRQRVRPGVCAQQHIVQDRIVPSYGRVDRSAREREVLRQKLLVDDK